MKQFFSNPMSLQKFLDTFTIYVHSIRRYLKYRGGKKNMSLKKNYITYLIYFTYVRHLRREVKANVLMSMTVCL